MSAYVELRAHSAFSFGDGTAAPEALIARAAELGYTALGLTDTADLGGIIRFALEGERRGVRPVIGAELIVDGCPMAFLARTAEGYRHLAALVTRARVGDARTWSHATHSHRTRGRPRLTAREVAERSGGLLALTGPAAGPLAAALYERQPALAARRLAMWREIFGEHLAVEVQLHHAGRSEEALAGSLIAFATRAGVPWVITNEPRYIDRAGRLVHDLFTALRAGTDLETASTRGLLLPNGSWRLASAAEMATRWAGREAGLEESARIAAACDFHLAWLRPPLPRFPVPAGESDDSYLRTLADAGARARWGAIGDRQRAQLDHELGVIRKLGFAGFFLVMWDAVRTAHERGILCQGRGSAANSAVAYCLGITAVDPVKHGLLFERFLSEERVGGQTEAPDIDVDIEHDRREEVLDYVYGHYDRSHAAITCIVQTYAAPNAVRDVMRALGYPAPLADPLSKRLHHCEPAAGAAQLRDGLAGRFGLSLDDARGRALLTAMGALDGVPRLRSTHPGGFVLSAEPLGDYLPIESTTMGRTIVQFDKDDLDAVGIPKFDFLGLGALSMVRRAFDVIEQRTGERPSMYRLPTEDDATYDLIARGETMGMFQIESRAQIASLVHTRPDRLYDIVVQVALIRPGPIQARFVHPYTRRRRGQEVVTYAHPALEPILRRTQGIPIFQEQAMAIAMALGGYTGAEADELRRTMGNDRKLPKLLAALERLRARMVAHGVGESVATGITGDLQSFANYGFPESHAWSFALIAYATAYLKAHHPAAFYAGLLNAWPMGFYPPASLVHDARRHGVPVRRPCLRDGQRECTVEDGEVEEAADGAAPAQPVLRIGWRFIRGVGDHALDRLEAARGGHPFTSIADIVHRAQLTGPEGVGLARAGALSAWEDDRRAAAWEALRAAGDRLPFAPAPSPAFSPRPLSRRAEIALDYWALGLSPLGHPMEQWRERLRQLGALDSRALAACRGGEWVIIGGLVTVRQRPHTANGTVFVLLEDEAGTINVIVSRQLAEANREVVHHSTFLVTYGRVERDGAAVNVIGRKFARLARRGVVHRSHDFR